MKRVCFFGVLCCWLTYYGQRSWTKNAFVSLKWNQGLVIPEYSDISYLAQHSLNSFEISWLKRTTGKNQTEQQYHYPEYGFTMFFTTLGNNQVFGQELALYPFFRNYFFRKKTLSMYHQFGFGLGFSNRRFDLISNPLNISIGSHLNMHFDYQLGVKFRLNPTMSAETGLRFSHFSNANMAEPNLGLNMVYVHAGLAKSIGKQEALIQGIVPPCLRSHEFAFIYAAGGKHTRALQSTLYFTSSLSAEYKYRAFHKFFFGAGLDLFFDSSTKSELSVKPNSSYQPRDNFSSGMHASQEIVYGSFSFILQEGWHLGLPDILHPSKMYNRAIIRWRFNPNLLLQFSMKSHLQILDYPELGFGYYFHR